MIPASEPPIKNRRDFLSRHLRSPSYEVNYVTRSKTRQVHFWRNIPMKSILGAQMRAARALLRWSASDLARHSGVSLSTIQRAEAVDGETAMTFPNAAAIRRAFENAGVEIIEEERAGPGARLQQPLAKLSGAEENGATPMDTRRTSQSSRGTKTMRAKSRKASGRDR